MSQDIHISAKLRWSYMWVLNIVPRSSWSVEWLQDGSVAAKPKTSLFHHLGWLPKSCCHVSFIDKRFSTCNISKQSIPVCCCFNSRFMNVMKMSKNTFWPKNRLSQWLQKYSSPHSSLQLDLVYLGVPNWCLFTTVILFLISFSIDMCSTLPLCGWLYSEWGRKQSWWGTSETMQVIRV